MIESLLVRECCPVEEICGLKAMPRDFKFETGQHLNCLNKNIVAMQQKAFSPLYNFLEFTKFFRKEGILLTG